MSSLWTPDGERRVNPSGADDAPADTRDEHRLLDASEEDNALNAELADIERQLLDAPIEGVIANHCYGFFQLAALHLGQLPPRLTEASLAIDALGAVVDTLGDRLGDSASTLRDGLAQLRLAFVQIAGVAAMTSDDPSDESPGDTAEAAPTT